MGNRIAHGLNPLEHKPAILIRNHDRALRRLIAVRVLHVIVAAAVRLPNVDFDALDRVALLVLDGAHGQHRHAFRVRGQAGAVGDRRGVVRVEGPQDGALGGVGRLGVVDAVDEEGEAEDVGEEDELLFA